MSTCRQQSLCVYEVDINLYVLFILYIFKCYSFKIPEDAVAVRTVPLRAELLRQRLWAGGCEAPFVIMHSQLKPNRK